MSTLFVKFPPDKEADALAYEAECTAHYRALNSAFASEHWGLTQQDGQGPWFLRQDRNSNWTVQLFGPPWVYGGNVVTEPASCAALRVDAVAVETPEWPEEE
jgi:hypothetical protein